MKHLWYVRIMTKGGPQIALALTEEVVPFWLEGIETSKLSIEKRALILAFLRKTPDTLYHHAFKEEGEQRYQPDAAPREAAPAGQGALSPQHVGHLIVLARARRASTGEPITALCAELEEVFGVEHFSDIPDAGWDVVQEWFLRRSQEA
jgi:hypothetical protein